MADLVAQLIAAGMADALVAKLEAHEIDKELLEVMDVNFMRGVLSLSAMEILQLKSYQKTMKQDTSASHSRCTVGGKRSFQSSSLVAEQSSSQLALKSKSTRSPSPIRKPEASGIDSESSNSLHSSFDDSSEEQPIRSRSTVSRESISPSSYFVLEQSSSQQVSLNKSSRDTSPLNSDNESSGCSNSAPKDSMMGRSQAVNQSRGTTSSSEKSCIQQFLNKCTRSSSLSRNLEASGSHFNSTGSSVGTSKESTGGRSQPANQSRGSVSSSEKSCSQQLNSKSTCSSSLLRNAEASGSHSKSTGCSVGTSKGSTGGRSQPAKQSRGSVSNAEKSSCQQLNSKSTRSTPLSRNPASGSHSISTGSSVGASKGSTGGKSQSASEDENVHPDSDSDSEKENTGQSSSKDFVTDDDVDTAVKNFVAEPIPTFSSLKGSLPEFDVVSILHKEFLKAHSRYKANFIELLEKKHLNRTKRLCIIRKLTAYIYLQYASSPLEVTSSMKEGMAKSFCVVFPKFANLDNKEQPWSPVYSPKGPAGYIHNASRAFMKEYRKRPNAKAQKRKATDDACDFDDDDVQALGLINAGREEKSEILDGMAKCFKMREDERRKGESITFFIMKYPQFKHYDGEVLSEEFNRMRPDAEDMCKLFLKLQPKILRLKLRREVELPINDDGVKALVILSQRLPHDIPKRGEKPNQSWAKLRDVLVVKKVSDDIEQYVLDRMEKSTGPVQPYIIFVRGQLDRNKILRTFIVLDRKTIQVQTVSSIKAIDWLFKCFFIFNVCYPFGWRNTFHFLQTCFYKIFENKGARKDVVNSSEFELMQALQSES